MSELPSSFPRGPFVSTYSILIESHPCHSCLILSLSNDEKKSIDKLHSNVQPRALHILRILIHTTNDPLYTFTHSTAPRQYGANIYTSSSETPLFVCWIKQYPNHRRDKWTTMPFMEVLEKFHDPQTILDWFGVLCDEGKIAVTREMIYNWRQQWTTKLKKVCEFPRYNPCAIIQSSIITRIGTRVPMAV